MARLHAWNDNAMTRHSTTHDTFRLHLSEAIALNERRRPYYARQTDGRSHRLSTMLITIERALLPVAVLTDACASGFQRQGIPIGRANFVSMKNVAPAQVPPPHRGTMNARQHAQLLDRVRCWRRRVFRHLLQRDLGTVCHDSAALLTIIERLEKDAQVHLAMSRHLVESAAYVALHGIDYAARSDGRTLGLTRAMVGGHALLGPWAVRLDRDAQAIHQNGAGILVNDLPPIPFRREWAAWGVRRSRA